MAGVGNEPLGKLFMGAAKERFDKQKIRHVFPNKNMIFTTDSKPLQSAAADSFFQSDASAEICPSDKG